jgi:uncharacterized protein YdeI (YjbR/CyaY-like superfamily)
VARLDDLERVEVDSRAALRAWLSEHHGQRDSIWLVTYKKAAGERHVSASEVVDEALCFGWIDSVPRKLDALRTMVLLAPRKRGSGWSAVNKAKIERLEAEGRMHAAGRAAIKRAKADGSWDLLNAVDALIVPDDLAAALGAQPGGQAAWERMAKSMRRGLLEQVQQAKKPATRAARIGRIVAMLNNGEG